MKKIKLVQKVMNFGTGLLRPLMIIVFMAGLSISCSKDSDEDEEPAGNFFVKGTISGQELTFSESATSVLESRLFLGFAGNTPNSEYPSFSFGIELVPISTGKFSETDPGIDMVFRYTVLGTEIYNSQVAPQQDFEITLTSLNGNIAEGTFKGTLTRENDPSQSIVISAGTFRLPID